ncbi:Rv1476 family membrane protein [Nocardia sp. bgisy118]|uniref:Rv1476 family membrane protein n=1 Tax=Nocardia sp. bgisy118 TaxID=3413786 RepID=UPI003F4A00F7
MAPSYTSVFSPMAAELPPTINDSALRTIKADVADNHVATPKGKDQAGLEAIVTEARSHGIPLSIVVIPGNPGHDSNLRDLATEIGKSQHGTVVVLSDDWVGTYSDSISRVQLEWAEDVAKGKQGNSVEAARVFVDRLEEPEALSWTAITSVLLAGTAIAIAGLYWVKSRRAARESAAVPVAEGDELAAPIR